MSSTESSPQRSTRLLARVVGGASGLFLVVITLTVLAAVLIPAVLNFRMYAIDGVSMEPNIHRGALAYAREAPVASLRRGDVITFVQPGHTRPVTHRIVAITRPDPKQGPVLRTKGDANPRPDLQYVRLDRRTQARYEMSIPLLGWVMMFLAIPWVKIAALAFPALGIAVWGLVSLWRRGGRILEERERTAEANTADEGTDREGELDARALAR